MASTGYSCNVCDESFTTTETLEQHLWTHIDTEKTTVQPSLPGTEVDVKYTPLTFPGEDKHEIINTEGSHSTGLFVLIWAKPEDGINGEATVRPSLPGAEVDVKCTPLTFCGNDKREIINTEGAQPTGLFVLNSGKIEDEITALSVPEDEGASSNMERQGQRPHQCPTCGDTFQFFR